jgi:hypothetical protein
MAADSCVEKLGNGKEVPAAGRFPGCVIKKLLAWNFCGLGTKFHRGAVTSHRSPNRRAVNYGKTLEIFVEPYPQQYKHTI